MRVRLLRPDRARVGEQTDVLLFLHVWRAALAALFVHGRLIAFDMLPGVSVAKPICKQTNDYPNKCVYLLGPISLATR